MFVCRNFDEYRALLRAAEKQVCGLAHKGGEREHFHARGYEAAVGHALAVLRDWETQAAGDQDAGPRVPYLAADALGVHAARAAVPPEVRHEQYDGTVWTYLAYWSLCGRAARVEVRLPRPTSTTVVPDACLDVYSVRGGTWEPFCDLDPASLTVRWAETMHPADFAADERRLLETGLAILRAADAGAGHLEPIRDHNDHDEAAGR